MAMAALWPQLAADLPTDLVKAGMSISGVHDLEPLVFAPFVNADLQLDAARARRLSPIHMPPATAAPLYTAVGGLESSEFLRQNRLLGKAWSSVFVRDVPMPGFNHLTVVDELANPASPLFDAAMAMVRST